MSAGRKADLIAQGFIYDEQAKVYILGEFAIDDACVKHTSTGDFEHIVRGIVQANKAKQTQSNKPTR